MNFFSAENKSLHEEYEQLQRQQRATELQLDSIDRDARTGKIKTYDVSLDGCTCVDFSRRHKPCKHMYRLAIELGIFSVDTEKFSDKPEKSPPPRKKIWVPEPEYEFDFYATVPKDFVVIDFETANYNFDSICQMGIAVVENNSVIETESFLIRPPYKKFTNTEIHGITFADVKKSPTFEELWPQIKNFVEGKTLAAYNLFFDWTCLNATLYRYKIPDPNFIAFDILENVREYDYQSYGALGLEDHKLVTVAKKLGLAHDAHNAASDALVAAQIQIYISETFPDEETLIYVPTIDAAVDAAIRNKIPSEFVRKDFSELFKDGIYYYELYEDTFAALEKLAALENNAVFYKFCGRFYEEQGQLSRALNLYRQAFDIDPKSGVKTRMQKVERLLKATSTI